MRTILLAFAAALAIAAQSPSAFAQAHGHGANGDAVVVQTTPSDGTMGAAPEAFSATFPHAMRLTSVVVTPQGGDPLAVDVADASAGTTVSVALPPLAPGSYTIAWTASSDDNHTMTGRVRYMVH